jgi:predicted RNase H-like HicB family nuclease
MVNSNEESSMKKKFTASVVREGKTYVAQCLEVDVASQGKTEAQALKNLREALELHFEDPKANHRPPIRQVQITVDAA